MKTLDHPGRGHAPVHHRGRRLDVNWVNGPPKPADLVGGMEKLAR